MVDQVRIAVAALVRDGRVLLVHRHPARRAYPDCWDLVGGHVELGESPEQAVRRECLEELGVTIHEPVAVPYKISDPNLDLRAFLVTRWDGDPTNTEPDEHDDLRWFHPTDLPDMKLAHPTSLSSIRNAVQVARSDLSASE